MKSDISARLGGIQNLHPELAGIIRDMDSKLARAFWLLGRDGETDKDGMILASAAPPPARFAVVGQDAHFIIDIINPQNVPPVSIKQMLRGVTRDLNQQAIPLLHQLRSSDSLLFDDAHQTTLYEPNAKLHWDLEVPNKQYYWQLRSSYDGRTWNEWQDYINPAVCGVQAIDSGLIRTSTTDWLNSSATTSSGTSPLSQHLLTTQIDVAASTWNAGDDVISFNLGTCDPGSFGTWHIYCLDPNKRGGAVTYLFTANPSTLTNQNGKVYFGKVTTAGGGGGTGSGGGGGFDPGTGCYGLDVLVRMLDGSTKKHRDLHVGDLLKGIDGGREEILSIDYLIKACFDCEFENGIAVPEVSSEQMWMYDGGGWDKVFDVVVGDRFTVMVVGVRLATRLTKRNYVGDFLVVKITLDRTRTFWVVTPAGDLGSHNMNKN